MPDAAANGPHAITNATVSRIISLFAALMPCRLWFAAIAGLLLLDPRRLGECVGILDVSFEVLLELRLRHRQRHDAEFRQPLGHTGIGDGLLGLIEELRHHVLRRLHWNEHAVPESIGGL